MIIFTLCLILIQAQKEIPKTDAEITEQSAALSDKAKEEVKEIEAEADKVATEIKKDTDAEAKKDSVKKDATATTGAAEGKEEPKGWKKYLAKIKSYAKKIAT